MKEVLQLARIYEQVHIWNVTNGERLITYALKGNCGEGKICINGAGAHLMHPGDIVIIATFMEIDKLSAVEHRPTIVLMNTDNTIKSVC